MTLNNFRLVAILIGLSGFVQAKTLETVLTCQQDDGDTWVEAGVVQNDGPGYRLIVVEHRDDNRIKLLFSKQVSKTGGPLVNSVFEDRSRTARLKIYKNGSKLKANLSLIADGPGSLSQTGLYCYKNSEISF